MGEENKVLKTRIKSLYKTWSQWQAIEGTDWDYGTGNYTIWYNYKGE
jgi:hypothetical protein